MSIGVPSDVIREVQKQIREQSGLVGYDPSLPSLPSLEDVIAELDPSPPYLRCKRCKGRFLSGAQSLFCVYCGAERHDPEVQPERIKFNSTVAYRWLLDALKLDGSEVVGQGLDENKPNRGQASLKKELTISELLDLEIRWPERPKKRVDVAVGDELSPNKSPVNLEGVDIENFFPSSKSVAAGSLEKPGSTAMTNESIDRTATQSHEDVDLFENVASLEADAQHNPGDNGNDSSGWAMQFQGDTTSVNSQNEKHSFDSSGYLSAQIDTVFGSETESKLEKSITGPTDPSPGSNDWNDEDLWSNFSSGLPEQPDKLEARNYEIQDVSRKLDISSNQSDDWVLGDKWQTSSGKVADSVNLTEDDDSYDAWNDFSASSITPQNQYNSSSEPLSSETQASEINLFSSNDLQDDVLGDFSQPALVSSSLTNISTGTNQLQLEANVSDRLELSLNSLANIARVVDDVSVKTEQLDAEGKSVDDAETLMSQMHDLSFMLESNLSIPKAMPDSCHPVLDS